MCTTTKNISRGDRNIYKINRCRGNRCNNGCCCYLLSEKKHEARTRQTRLNRQSPYKGLDKYTNAGDDKQNFRGFEE